MNGLEWSKNLLEKAGGFFRAKKGAALFCLGIAGIVLVAASTFLPDDKSNPTVGATEQDAQAYIAKIEERLTSLVSNIDGVGKCEVMVTAENGVEYVYAVEETQNVNQTNSFSGDAVQKQTQQQNIEQKYIVVDTGGGRKQALLKTQKQPTVQGVVVVCEGAASTVVQQRITEAVTTALGIPYTKVCVTKIQS